MHHTNKTVCPACNRIDAADVIYKHMSKTADLLKCEVCGLYYIWPPASFDKEIYKKGYYDAWSLEELGLEGLAWMKRATFRRILDRVAKYKNKGSLLDVGCAFGELLCCAKEKGWDGWGVEISEYAACLAKGKIGADRIITGNFMDQAIPKEKFDVTTMIDFIEHIPNPQALLEKCRGSLKQNGLLTVVTPDMDSISRRCMGKNWPHFNREHLIFFSKENIEKILDINGFRLLEASNFSKALNLYYISSQIRAHKGKVLARFAGVFNILIPPPLKKINFYIPSGEIFIIAQKR